MGTRTGVKYAGLTLPTPTPNPSLTAAPPDAVWDPRLARVGAVTLLALALAVAVRAPELSIHVGEPAPPLRLATLDSGPVDLSVHRGKPMLLNFFATWCRPCQAEVPILNRLHASLHDAVTVAGVLVFSGPPGPEAAQGVARLGPVYPVWVTNEETAAAWSVAAVPVTVLLDRRGVVAWVSQGMVDEDEVRAALAALAP